MDYIPLGNTGLKVSELCFGTWRFGRESGGVIETDLQTAHELLDTAWDFGLNFIDTANGYGDPDGTSERWIGEWLTDHDREDFVIGSKVGYPFDGCGETGPNDSGLGRKHIRAQIEGTLDRLNTDYLDMYHIHSWDPETPIVETMRTLNDLVREGKVHHIGVSTIAARHLVKAREVAYQEDLENIQIALPPFDATHTKMRKYDDFDLESYLSVCEDEELAICPHSPLAGGFLTGKYERGEEMPTGSRGSLTPDRFNRYFISDAAWRVLDEVKNIANELDVEPAQIALAWLMHQDQFSAVVPIIGARTIEQLTENVVACDVDLKKEHMDRIVEARGRVE